MPRARKFGKSSALTRLAGGLAGLFAVELLFAMGTADHRLPSADFAAQAIDEQTTESVNPSQSVLAAQRAILLGRPLFSPSRRPPPASYAQAIPVEMPKLSGTMITPRERIAVLLPANGRPIIVAQNGRFGAFTVLSIAQDSVTLLGPSGIVTLRSNFREQEASGKSTPTDVILPGGIDLSQINIPPPSAATWNGPPAAH